MELRSVGIVILAGVVGLGAVGLTLMGSATVQPYGGARILADSISHGINPADGTPTDLNSTFQSSNPGVYSMVILGGSDSGGYNITWHWITPQGSVYRDKSSAYPAGVASQQGGNLTYVDSIRLNGAVAGELLGDWRVAVFVDGRLSLVQGFSVVDPIVPAQPVRPVPWPSKVIDVRVSDGPQFAHDAVVAAVAQWNYSQVWFQSNFPHATPWTYQFVLSSGGPDIISVTFNQTVTSGYTSDSSVKLWRASLDSPWRATCAVSLVLTLRNGTALNDVFIENSAMLQVGRCLGLGPVYRSGDLMNNNFPNVYDLNSPSTLNLYALDRMIANNQTANPPTYYTLPDGVPYVVSPQPAGAFFGIWDEVFVAGSLAAVGLVFAVETFRGRKSGRRSVPD